MLLWSSFSLQAGDRPLVKALNHFCTQMWPPGLQSIIINGPAQSSSPWRRKHLYRMLCLAIRGLKNSLFQNNPFESWHEGETAQIFSQWRVSGIFDRSGVKEKSSESLRRKILWNGPTCVMISSSISPPMVKLLGIHIIWIPLT